MDSIKITQNGKTLAEHSTDSPLSHYGLPVWTILEENPSKGAALWLQGAVKQRIVIIGVRDGWLVVKQSDGLLSAIIWSDGNYYANLLVDADVAECGGSINGRFTCVTARYSIVVYRGHAVARSYRVAQTSLAVPTCNHQSARHQCFPATVLASPWPSMMGWGQFFP